MVNVKKIFFAAIIGLSFDIAQGGKYPNCATKDDKVDIYDLRAKAGKETCLIGNSNNEKSFTIKNTTNRDVYVRISYEIPSCDPTGFVLGPQQSGRMFRSLFCSPRTITGHAIESYRTKGSPIKSTAGTAANGHHRWDVKERSDGSLALDYAGKWRCVKNHRPIKDGKEMPEQCQSHAWGRGPADDLIFTPD